MGWLSGWAKRIKLTIDSSKVDSALSDFPLLVHLSISSGIASTDVSAVFDELASDANRKKIALATSDGITQCYVEIEKWDHSSEEAWLWVKVPSILAASDTVLYIYYDSTQSDNTTYVGDTGETPAQNVWDSNFVAVWHLDEVPAGVSDDIKDSTGAHHGTTQSALTSDDSVDGQIGNALQFEYGGVADRVDIGDHADFSFGTNDFTIEHLLYPSGGGTTFCNYVSTNKLHAPFLGSATAANVIINGANSITGITLSANTWQYFSLVRDGNDLKAHVNTVQQGSTANVTGVSIGSNEDNYIGASETASHTLTGKLDEMRISSVARSVAWQKATYHTCFDNLITFGNAESSNFISGILTLRGCVADLTGISILRSSLGTGGIQCLLNTLWAYGIQGLRLKMSDDLLQVLRTSFGDQGILNLLSGMGLEGRQALRLQVGTFAAGVLVLRSLISGEPVTGMAQTIRLSLNATNSVTGVLVQRLALQGLSAQYPFTSFAIYIDGRPVMNRIKSATIDYSQDDTHNAITITSTDFELYKGCDPGTLSGEQRIEVQVGTRVLYFLIEERSGDDRQYSIWGRSLSARDDSAHAVESSYTQGDPELASSVAAGLLVHAALDWEAPDWVLPEDFEFFGPPLEGVSRIASAIGAVARSRDDGSIMVRRRYPVRPVDLPTTTPDIQYSPDEDIIEVGYSRHAGSGYNAVEIYGYSPETFLPDLEVEESSPVQGEEVHVRAYWAGQIPASSPVIYVTAGDVKKLANGTISQTERVVFSGGTGELTYPPESISNISWVGASGGTVSWEKHTKTMTISNVEPRLADVTYSTAYARYRLYDHDVEALVFTMVVSPAQDVSVRVVMGTGDRQALDITESLLTSRGIAVERGRAFLDNSRYDYHDIDIVAPYRDEAVDGTIIALEDSNLSISGNAQILSSAIEFDGLRVLNRIRARQWLES